jgi:hypothetical protein
MYLLLRWPVSHSGKWPRAKTDEPFSTDVNNSQIPAEERFSYIRSQ